mgnify:CR=1 FL=1
MPEVSQPPRQLLLDLRKTKRSSLPAIDGLTVVNPNPSAECGGAGSALAVFVALDGEAAYAEWLQRFHPMCPSGFPNVMLLDPYDPVLARRILRGDAADCCAMDDVERIELIVVVLRDSRGCLADRGRLRPRARGAAGRAPAHRPARALDARLHAGHRQQPACPGAAH